MTLRLKPVFALPLQGLLRSKRSDLSLNGQWQLDAAGRVEVPHQPCEKARYH